MSLVKCMPNEIRYDPTHAVSNIFRVLSTEYKTMPTVDNPRPPRLRYWEHVAEVDGCRIKFKGLFLLSDLDLHVLLGALGVALQVERDVHYTTPSDEGKFLRNTLAKHDGAEIYETPDPADMTQMILELVDSPSIPVAAVATCSQYMLTKLITGTTDGTDNYKRIKESLFRLAHTTIEVRNKDGSKFTSNMISSVFEKGHNISIAINPVLTRSLRLDTGARYIKLYLQAFSKLSSVGKLLYTYLAGRTWDGFPHEYTTPVLVELMYPPIPGATPVKRDALTKRTKSVASAMQDIGTLKGWKVEEKESSKGLQKWIVTHKTV